MTDEKIDVVKRHFEILSFVENEIKKQTIYMEKSFNRKIVDYVLLSSYANDISNGKSLSVKFDGGDNINIESVEHKINLEVKHLLKLGFQVFGDIKLINDDDGYLCAFQAMVKYEDSKDDR